MQALFVPGCALSRHRPASIDRMSRWMLREGIIDGLLTTCCKACRGSDERMTMIVCCPGCSHKFEALYPNASVVSLWKVLLNTDFSFRITVGKRCLSTIPAVPGKGFCEMQASARELCRKMNIALVEPLHTRETAVCCGGSAPDLVTRKKMAQERAKAFRRRMSSSIVRAAPAASALPANAQGICSTFCWRADAGAYIGMKKGQTGLEHINREGSSP